jgi:hypothetical protein
VREILLTQGQVALVHENVYEWVSQFKWYASWSSDTQSFYAMRDPSKGQHLPMQTAVYAEFVGPVQAGYTVDHIDGDTLNNDHTSNLRLATASQQVQNRGLQANNTSGFKGVVWHSHAQKWWARIKIHGRVISLRYYTEAADAARAYDVAALEHFGEFARLNFPEEA